jgi:hypothetical protein
MHLDPRYLIPEQVTNDATLDNLLDLLRNEQEWDEHPARILDHAYRERLIRAIESRADAAPLRELRDHLSRAAVLIGERLDNPDTPYPERWRTLRDLLENRLALLRSAAPELAMQRAHVPEILDLIIAEPDIEQAEVGRRLGLEGPNLTRVLKLMENNGLVIRRSRGRSKQLTPGPNAERMRPADTAAEDPPYSDLLSPEKSERAGNSRLALVG